MTTVTSSWLWAWVTVASLPLITLAAVLTATMSTMIVVNHTTLAATLTAFVATLTAVVVPWLWNRGLRSWPWDMVDDTHLWRRKRNLVSVAEETAQSESEGGKLLAIRWVGALERLTNANIPTNLREGGQHLRLHIWRWVRKELEELLTEAKKEAGRMLRWRLAKLPDISGALL